MKFCLSAALISALLVSVVDRTFADSSSDRVYVLGEVQSPGAMFLTDASMTVVDAIAHCGGFTKHADECTIRLIHHLPGLKSQITLVNLVGYFHSSPNSPQSPASNDNPILQPGDVIDVPLAVNK
jgi:protein involved in polysaccharide export with SLBB domain